ncbi:uncharacterized protein BDZ99DRAFT_523287 [Mytilinidion resinicola]|uniref:ATP synthase F(0) complex subunit e, mitochondrial n=1 Tax=Mytilinidion resinicola TaxID=574789 RepID=A0A6A6YDV7_9PEZI|nr:uncharacterized protein BDZ99DRAFT_523287 [Mytilinidion resinicola]KAF2806713.1 hypothetical protein BDZ99DRAFT_523287 [Mytilinidion resinicola]
MSTSVGVNVLRWSALGLGVFYGFTHQVSLSSREKLDKINREYKHKEDLIAKAKAEWAKKTAPTTASGDLITDPENPKFDLEAYLTVKAAETT